MKKNKVSIYLLIFLISLLCLELLQVVPIGKIINHFLPCFQNSENSAPCYLKYDIIAVKLLLFVIVVNLLWIFRKYLKWNKTTALLLILIIAPILGGIYGVIHDQITYSISEEYYTKFKFIQFGLENWESGQNIGTGKTPEIILDNPRIGAAIVGILATWWVGLIIGVFLGLIGLIHRNGKEMFIVTAKAIALTTGIALLTGLIGLLYGKVFLVENPPNWFLPDNLIDRGHFIMVGSMHNFSYLGGLIGLIVGIGFSMRQKRKYKNGIQQHL
ncbi:MAG: hypothetical protein ACR2MS_04370 [Weeksellaceae bacterium]